MARKDEDFCPDGPVAAYDLSNAFELHTLAANLRLEVKIDKPLDKEDSWRANEIL